jgi:SAM-dependent methyltransferase
VARQPKRWKDISWEEMAQENPLFAVMTTDSMAEAPSTDFTPEQRDELFRKGRKLFARHLRKLLAKRVQPPEAWLVAEYGCGVGRILNAAIEAGYRCAGIDISPTMLEHCRRLVPRVEALYPLDGHGRCAMPSESARLVFSFAVVQHIASLKNFVTAFDEMCRILQPGGILTVQVNCKDFEGGDLEAPERTENHETYSLHFRAGEDEPYLRHDQNQWSGVYVGHQLLTELLVERGMVLRNWRYHSPDKPLSVWFVASKLKRREAPAPPLGAP